MKKGYCSDYDPAPTRAGRSGPRIEGEASRLIVERETGRIFSQSGAWRRWIETTDESDDGYRPSSSYSVEGVRWDWDNLVPTGEFDEVEAAKYAAEQAEIAARVTAHAAKVVACAEKEAWAKSLSGRTFAGLTVGFSGLEDEYGNYILPLPSPRSDGDLVSWINAQDTFCE